MSRRLARVAGLVAAIGLACAAPPAAAIEIVGVPFGTELPPPDTTGGGSLDEVFAAAAALWERALLDEHTVTIQYGWAPLLSDYGGYASFITEADGRATGGIFLMSNTAATRWFIDPTPHTDEEFGVCVETELDLGSPFGPVNVGRELPGVAAATIDRFDLFSVVLHEIGHTLGLTELFSGLEAEAVDRDVDVGPALPFAGAAVPIYDNGEEHIELPTASMNPEFERGERRLLSAADVLAVAQINGFTQVELAPVRIPAPDAARSGLAAAVALLAARARAARQAAGRPGPPRPRRSSIVVA